MISFPVQTMVKFSRPGAALVWEVAVVHASAWESVTETVKLSVPEPVVPDSGETCNQGELEIATQFKGEFAPDGFEKVAVCEGGTGLPTGSENERLDVRSAISGGGAVPCPLLPHAGITNPVRRS